MTTLTKTATFNYGNCFVKMRTSDDLSPDPPGGLDPEPPDEGLVFRISGDSFILPLSARSGSSSTYGTYDITVDWGDGSPTQVLSGTASSGDGVEHTYSSSKNWDIKVTPNAKYGLKGVGFTNGTTGSNVATNKSKLIALSGQLTENNCGCSTAPYACYSKFYSCANLISVSADFLPATTLAEYCYYSMFQGCANLTSASKLPAADLATSCYTTMFYGCASLTQAPALPATTLARSCYSNMLGSSGLTQAPALPATTLAERCYDSMFTNCKSLTTAPALPATTLVDWCYVNMFRLCTGLTQAPVLPATTLAQSCYTTMFYDCTGLIQAPALPATTLVPNCYYDMFHGCTSLTQSPVLSATELAEMCYNKMFYGCTSLTQAPALPATTLVPNCYGQMFYGCTNLTQAPALPATTLVSNCYYDMFYDCRNIAGTVNIAANSPAVLPYLALQRMFYLTSPPTTGGITAVTGGLATKMTAAITDTSNQGVFRYQTKLAYPVAYDSLPTGWK